MNFLTALAPFAGSSIMLMGVMSAVDTYNALTAPAPIVGNGAYVGPPVHPGGRVIVNWTLHKRMDCHGQDSRHWRGENGFYLRGPSGETGLPQTDEPQHYSIPTDIPREAPPGALQLEIIGQYECPEGTYRFSLGPVLFEVEGE